MAGGSFDYLYRMGWGFEHRDALERMATRLETFGKDSSTIPPAADAAEATRSILRRLVNDEATLVDPLRGIWKAVEWYDSGDFGEDAVVEALRKWREHSHTDPVHVRLVEERRSAEAQAAHFLAQRESVMRERDALQKKVELLEARLRAVAVD